MAESFHNVESDPLNFYGDYVLGSPAMNAATNLRKLMNFVHLTIGSRIESNPGGALVPLPSKSLAPALEEVDQATAWRAAGP